jgi:hypothetical protein
MFWESSARVASESLYRQFSYFTTKMKCEMLGLDFNSFLREYNASSKDNLFTPTLKHIMYDYIVSTQEVENVFLQRGKRYDENDKNTLSAPEGIKKSTTYHKNFADNLVDYIEKQDLY